MLRSLTDWLRYPVNVWVGPGRVRLARARLPLSRRRDPALRYGCSEADITVPAWQPATYALEQLLSAHPVRGASASVTLSNHFVRFVVIPALNEARNAEEQQVLARAAFRSVFGDAADDWKIKIAVSGRRRSALAAAIDLSLAETLAEIFEAGSVQLKSLRPFFADALNASRALLPPDHCWFAVAERDHVVVAFQRDGEWELVRSRRMTGPIANDLLVLLEQARLADGVDRPAGRVYLHAAGRSRITFPTDSPWRVRSLVAPIVERAARRAASAA